MAEIRFYRENDSFAAGQLIAETYSRFNLSSLPEEERNLFLGPFRYADSQDRTHQEAIAQVIRSAIVLVAEDGGQLVGVLRGRQDRLGSLFVRGDCQRQGIGSALVKRFEMSCHRLGATVIRVASTLYAVPFYQAMGYKKSTGIRSGWSFDGRGLMIQPMKKKLERL